MRHLFVLFPLLLVSLSCNGQERIAMQGKLVYTPGYNGIYEFDLATRKERLLVEITYSPETITAIDRSHFLIGTNWSPSFIQEFDSDKLTFKPVLQGYDRPVYMLKHRKFFHFGGDFYLSYLDKPKQTVRKIAEGYLSYSHAIPISDDEVVFSTEGDAGRSPPSRYNLVTDKLERLPITRQCTPYVWRSASNQLLCGIDGKGEFYLIGLDGKHSTPVDFSGLPDKSPLPLLYIPKYDVLILYITRTEIFDRTHGVEHSDLWAYSFKDGRSEKLLENHAPGRGGIVWVDRAP